MVGQKKSISYDIQTSLRKVDRLNHKCKLSAPSGMCLKSPKVSGYDVGSDTNYHPKSNSIYIMFELVRGNNCINDPVNSINPGVTLDNSFLMDPLKMITNLSSNVF